jgi:hypothetical protein
MGSAGEAERRSSSPARRLSRRWFQTYPSCRSWCASSPKDPVIAQSPAYHDYQLHRLLLNLSDTICRALRVSAGGGGSPRLSRGDGNA